MTTLAKIACIALLTVICACAVRTSTTLSYETFRVDATKCPNVIIFDHSGASGYEIQFFVSRDSIKVFRKCDSKCVTEDFEYRQSIDNLSGERFSDFLSTLPIDTMRNNYFTPGGCGLTRLVFVQRSPEEYKSVRLERFSHPTINLLVTEVRNLIKDETILTAR